MASDYNHDISNHTRACVLLGKKHSANSDRSCILAMPTETLNSSSLQAEQPACEKKRFAHTLYFKQIA